MKRTNSTHTKTSSTPDSEPARGAKATKPANPNKQDKSAHDNRTVMLVGGIGRMESRYREALAEKGYDLLYYEKKIAGTTLAAALAAILVVTTVVSHPLKDHARTLAEDKDIPIIYIKEPSVSSIKRALDGLPSDEEEAAQTHQDTQAWSHYGKQFNKRG
jgi:hypothetical protein